MPRSLPDHRTDDRRWNAVDRTMQRHDYRPEALIETLHTAQKGTASWTRKPSAALPTGWG